MPSNRRRPDPGAVPPRRPAGGRPGGGRGVSGHEREELLSEPPEYQSGDRLDTIGLDSERMPAAASTTGRRVSSRHMRPASSASQREKQAWAKQRLKNLKMVGWVAAAAAAVGVLCYIPVYIRNDRIKELYSSKAAVRMAAAVNIGELRSGLDLLPPIVRGCQKIEDFDRTCGAAASALGFAGEAGLDRLKTLAGDENSWARLCAAYGLGLTRQPAAVEPLTKCLSDGELIVRVQAAKSLGRIRTAASVRALVEQAQAMAEVRDAAVAAIFDIACQASPEHLAGRAEIKAELLKGLGASTASMRQACGRALIMLNQVPEDAELLDRTTSENPAIKASAVEFLGLIGGQLFEVTVPKALTDKSPEVRAAAASAAGLRRWASGTESLENLVASAGEPVEVRQAAAEALGLIGRLSSVVPLAKALTMDPTEKALPARLAAAKALSAIALANPPALLAASGEAKDLLTHIKLSAAKPDPRWQALEILVAGCDDFGEKLGPDAFQAMNDLAKRQRAPKPEAWKAWIAKKQDEARELSRIGQLFDQAYAVCRRNKGTMTAEAAATFRECARIFDELRGKKEPDDEWFYEQLGKDLEPYTKPAAEVPAPTKPADQPAGAAATPE